MLVALIGAHFFLDFAGQGDFMAKAKNPNNPISGIPWYTVMFGHAFIHGTAVALITGIWWLVFLETYAHFQTDLCKCENSISFNVDQIVHVLFKVLWWVFPVIMPH